MSALGNKKIMAKNINYYMSISGKTRNDICNALGIKYTTFTDWIKANSYPRIDKIELMANYFGINKSDLVEDHQQMPSSPQLSADQLMMIKSYNKLNSLGKEKAKEYISDLTEQPKYTVVEAAEKREA